MTGSPLNMCAVVVLATVVTPSATRRADDGQSSALVAL